MRSIVIGAAGPLPVPAAAIDSGLALNLTSSLPFGHIVVLHTSAVGRFRPLLTINALALVKLVCSLDRPLPARSGRSLESEVLEMRLRNFHRSMLGVVGVAALLWVAFGYLFNRMMALKYYPQLWTGFSLYDSVITVLASYFILTSLSGRWALWLGRERPEADLNSLGVVMINDPPKHCGICRRVLDIPKDPLSIDCGGDCWGCVGEIEADSGWPESLTQVRAESEAGLRPDWIDITKR